MSRSIRILCCALIGCLLSAPSLFAQENPDEKVIHPYLSGGPLDEEWKTVYTLELARKPKEAREAARTIYEQAVKQNLASERIKAVLFEAKFAALLDENGEWEVIDHLRMEADRSEGPERQVMLSYLNQLYEQYFEQYRWKIMDRSPVEDSAASQDFRFWDGPKFYREMKALALQSLEDPTTLQSVPISAYDNLITLVERDTFLLPTLYDALAQRSLDHLKNDGFSPEIRAADRSYIGPDFLGSTEAFLGAAIPDRDSSATAEIFRIYKELTLLHTERAGARKLAILNLERIEYAYSLLSAPQKEDWRLEGIEELIAGASDPLERHLYLLRKARMFRDLGGRYDYRKGEDFRWKLRESKALPEQVLKESEDPYALSIAENQRDKLLEPDLQFSSEEFVYPGVESLLKTEYKNLDSLYFTVYRVPYDTKIYYSRHEIWEELPQLGRDPVHAWGVLLPESQDLQQHSAEFVLPALDKGSYVVLAHPCPRPMDTDFYAYQKIQATSLVLYSNSVSEDEIEFKVRDRWDGRIKPEAKIQIEFLDRKGKKRLQTDEQGFKTYRRPDRSYSINTTVTWEKDTLELREYIRNRYRYGGEEEELEASLFVMTDRTLYRPGQPLYFKIIGSLKTRDKYSVLSGATIEYELTNPNGERILGGELNLSEMGSAHARIDLPEGGLTGSHRIRASIKTLQDEQLRRRSDQRDGYANIQVEEYKRPTFYLEFPPDERDPSLGDSIRVQGLAKAYSGSLITDASVSYRVTRGVERPNWWYRWYGFPGSEQEPVEIASGSTVTDQEGAFELPFVAMPGEGGADSDSPVYVFTVYAEVTDLNGETRTLEKRIRIGKVRLQAEMQVPSEISRQDRDAVIRVSTTNLNGDFSPARGTLQVFALHGPAHAKRKRPWTEAEFPAMDSLEFQQRFPHEYFQEKDENSVNWSRGKSQWKVSFDTAIEKEYKLGSLRRWPAETYLLALNSQDSEGNEVIARHIFRVMDPKAKELPGKNILWTSLNKESFEPGEVAELKVGSSLNTLMAEVMVEKDHRIVTRKTIYLRNDIQTLKIPIEEADRGGFVVWVQSTGLNEYQSEKISVNVKHKDAELLIFASSFRDLIEPGAQESWSFRLQDSDGAAAEAEVLASMYDASLDAIMPFSWSFSPIRKPGYYSHSSLGTRSFAFDYSKVHGLSWSIYPARSLRSPVWTDFGLNVRPYWQYRTYLSKLRPLFNRIGWVAASYDPELPEGLVSGVVTDENNGEPLPGANIVIKGTSIETQTDFDGRFTIRAPKGSVLQIQYVGFKTLEYAVDRNNTLSISMSPESQTLEEEVVVQGYNLRRGIQSSGVAAADEENASGFFSKEVAITGRAEGVDLLESADTPPPPLTEADSIAIDLSEVQARTNLRETAFFLPQLRTDADGRVQVEFESPEALTRWNVWLLAHDKQLNNGYGKFITVTQKKLMVVPNMPRYLREGDRMLLRAKVSNLSEEAMIGKAELEFTDPISGESLNGRLGLSNSLQDFVVSAGGNTVVSWEIQVPEGLQAVQYRVVAGTGTFSDGQQDILPVLTNRTLITETLPLWVNGNETREFELTGLKETTSSTLSHQQLTLEITGNPVWYAIQSLPYLMEYPYECSEQTFSRVYANSLGAYIVHSYPQIESTWKKWEESENLQSKLEQNPELKALLIEETPWLRDAQSEAEQKKRMVQLFEDRKLNRSLRQAIDKLADMQFSSGGFPWFKGSRYESRYITQHIASGLGHLKALGVTGEASLNEALQTGKLRRITERAIDYLDVQIAGDYERLLKRAGEIEKEAKSAAQGKKARIEYLAQNRLSHAAIQYLYVRSFFPELEIPEKAQSARKYYHEQLIRYWDQYNLYAWAMAGLYFHRSGEEVEARKVWTTIDQLSVNNEETGTFWKENRSGWFWYQAPVETQALLIEFYDELMPEGDEKLKRLGGMKTWLLKQKQTQAWRSTKATTEAIYALLRGGKNVLKPGQLSLVLGSRPVEDWNPKSGEQEAGTGYRKFTFAGDQIRKEMADIRVTKSDEGPTWGAAYWQYFEDLDRVKSAETPLKLRKRLYKREFNEKGEVLIPLDPGQPLEVGDLVRVRIELESDRKMEYLHLKDHRAASFEPVDVISGYRYQEGLWYYQSTRDASTNFFIENIGKDSYVFEYDLRVAQEGNFSNGYANIQSMYAPEFSSHSEGARVQVGVQE